MGSSKTPDVIKALVAYATDDLADVPVLVSFGLPVGSNDSDVLAFGVSDLSADNDGYAGTSDQVPGPNATTRPRDETGSIVCIAYACSGDGNAETACDNAFSYMRAVEDRLRITPNLGIRAGGYFVASIGTGNRFDQRQTEIGAEAFVVFNVSFVARI